MNRIIEENFIRTFVRNNMQDRFIFELSHRDERKRIHAISRFDRRGNYLKGQYIYFANKNLTLEEAKRELLKLQNSINECYLITFEHSEYMQFNKALKTSFDWSGVSIIIISTNLAFIKVETEYGPPEKFILYKE